MINLKRFIAGTGLFLVLQACSLPGAMPVETEPPTAVAAVVIATETAASADPVAPAAIQHVTVPISAASNSAPYPDVTSLDTAPEQRAPYGDSYEINRFERPFTQNMTYIADLDISSFGISEEGEFYFISIGLVGTDPNNSVNIKYSLELDTDRDSFGDFLIVAEPPYSEEWTAENVRIYSDTNQDSAGYSPSRSDAPFPGNGYDALIYDIKAGIGDDSDLAWVRINAGPYAVVQFAIKKSFTGGKFFYSVMADAGLQDVARMDYVDYFTEAQAGSSVRSNVNYPLKELFAVDNTCYQAMGFTPTGFEPKICSDIVQPQNVSEPGQPPSSTCADPGNCTSYGYGWYFDPLSCSCTHPPKD
ncbi:hypothetical protein MASR2M66_20490 [Chloroflexota bacterium]